jgi:molybdopterin synthase sulfur carrier subunit
MQSGIKVEISLFGAFRKFDNGRPFVLIVPQSADLSTIRQELGAELANRYPEFNQHTLINESALADERAILREDYRVERDTRLAILPPVCGG